MTDNINFQLNIVHRGGVRSQDPDNSKRRADAENGRQKAQGFAEEALLAAVSVMRHSKDPTQILKACKMIMDRAWGIPKSADEEEANAKNQSIVEILAAFSSGNALAAPEPTPALEHQAQPVTRLPVPDLDDLLLDADYAGDD